MDCSPPGPSVHGIFQARVLEWGAITFSASNNRQTLFLTTVGNFFMILPAKSDWPKGWAYDPLSQSEAFPGTAIYTMGRITKESSSECEKKEGPLMLQELSTVAMVTVKGKASWARRIKFLVSKLLPFNH